MEKRIEMNSKLESKFKEFDEWCDKNATTPEQAMTGKQEMRDQIDKIPVENFKIFALDAAIRVAKMHSNKH